VSAKWDYDKTEHLSCGQYYYEYYFTRGDEPKEWTLQEVAKHLSAMEVEVERMTDVLDKSAIECAEEQTRLESIINDMSNENSALRDAMTCACKVMSPQFAAHEVLTIALAGKESSNGD
jgi:hypothetical protein